MNSALSRAEAMQQLQAQMTQTVELLGVTACADELHVSTDTIRRRMRGTQPWLLTEALDLARYELRARRTGMVADALTATLRTGTLGPIGRPLLVPSNLRQALRLIGTLVAEIANAMEDGRIDQSEARRLMVLFGQLDELATEAKMNLSKLITDQPA